MLHSSPSKSMLMKVSSPADVLWTSLLTAPAPPSSPTYSSYLHWFVAENKARLTEAHAYVRGWFVKRGVQVADSNAGHFVWVNLGQRVGWTTAAEEKKGFQTLLDGGVYIVGSHCRTHLRLKTRPGVDFPHTLMMPGTRFGLPLRFAGLVPSYNLREEGES